MQQKAAKRARRAAPRSIEDPRISVGGFPPDIIKALNTRASYQGARSVASVIREAVIFALNHPDFARDRAA